MLVPLSSPLVITLRDVLMFATVTSCLLNIMFVRLLKKYIVVCTLNEDHCFIVGIAI